MGQTFNENDNFINFDLICKNCDSHVLIELIQNEKNIFIKKSCFCECLISYLDNSEIFNFTKIKNINANSSINEDNLLYKCRYHKESIITGFCKRCKYSICNECINNFHNNHEIKYIKDLNELKNMNEILEIYNNNLNKAFNNLNNLIKMKYGENYNIEITNIIKPQNISLYNKQEQQIILCLKLLKTFFDIYNYKKNKNILDNQSIYHIIKHRNFEIIKDKENININKYTNIGNYTEDDYISNKNKGMLNKNINISIKIELKEKEELGYNEMNIKFNRRINKDARLIAKKLIRLKNGDLAYLCYANFFGENLNKIYNGNYCRFCTVIK